MASAGDRQGLPAPGPACAQVRWLMEAEKRHHRARSCHSTFIESKAGDPMLRRLGPESAKPHRHGTRGGGGTAEVTASLLPVPVEQPRRCVLGISTQDGPVAASRGHAAAGRPRCSRLATRAGDTAPDVQSLSSWYLNDHPPADNPGGDCGLLIGAGLQLPQLSHELLQAGKRVVMAPGAPLPQACLSSRVFLEVLFAQLRGRAGRVQTTATRLGLHRECGHLFHEQREALAWEPVGAPSPRTCRETAAGPPARDSCS